ncbi:MAG TPA: methyl-accepting chemotaxis protein [Burkholderiaceae bacterium]|nr:methyl-accepting chemotaxis protein [Burkholderiaceae bacterium]
MKNLISRLAAAYAALGTRTQLFGAFAAVLVLTAAVGLLGLVGLQRVDSDARELSGKWLPGVGHLASARAAALEARDFEIKHSRATDKSYHAEYEDKIKSATKTFGDALAGYEKLVAGDDERKFAQQLAKTWAEYQKAQQRVVALGREGKQQDAADISDGLSSTAADEVLASIDKLWKFNFEGGALASEHAQATYQLAVKAVLVLLGVALAIGLGLAWGFSRALLRRLGGEPAAAAQVAQAVAAGDLSTPIVLREGDRSSLMAQLHAMQSSLAQAVSAVRAGSENVATASAQIAEGNNDLSRRTEQQASALQQTAATMDELGSTVRNNAENAQQANQLARGASQVAVQGGEVVGQVVQTMKGIQDASRKIGDIISVIDGIAFQTNILALNAAVEAARAGEQGRGFAVVAAEVRSLAQRSAEAAKEIKGLITASVERVETGTALVDRAGTTMDETVKAIQRVTDIVAEISAASSEQSSGVSQVGQAVTQMDQATQQNAALVEESAAAAESMRQQAAQLLQAVAVFKLGNERAMPVLATPVTPAPKAPVAAPAPARTAVERRGPNRAINVTRPKFGAPKAAPAPAAASAKTGSDDWESF